MSLGVYSVVRFNDSMRDERVNLGVIVWHPHQGYAVKIPPSLDRAKVINPLLDAKDIKAQIKFLQSELSADGHDGRMTLERLSKVFHEGFEVSTPYPTRISGKDECADHLFHLLVNRAPAHPEQTVATESAFARLANGLRAVTHGIDPTATVQDMGEEYITNVRVQIGIRTTLKNIDCLWRILQLNKNGEEPLVRAKAASLDILKVHGLERYRKLPYRVAVQSPRRRKSTFEEAKKCLTERAEVVTFEKPEELEPAIGAEFNRMLVLH